MRKAYRIISIEVADILNSLALLQTYDVNLICIEKGIDSSQTSGKLLI